MDFNLCSVTQKKTNDALDRFNDKVDANLDAFMSLNKITVEDFQKNGVVKNYFASFFGDSSYKRIDYCGKEIFRVTITVTGKEIKIDTIWAK